jgi:ABC-2 type transport system ATP-binding protein
MDAIRTEKLTRRFGDVIAVDSLTFSVTSGEIFGIVGPDGAGKSTTMRMLASILVPTEGDAWIEGYSIKTDGDSIKDNIAYMSQQFGLYPDLTVMENIEFYADVYGVKKQSRKERIDRLLSFSYMEPFKKRLAANLSGGMKQKLQLICALIHTPKVLLLDEPTNGVDPVSRRDFWRILYQLLKEGVTIFISTAYLDEAERCNRLILLHQGKTLAVGTPDQVKEMMRGEILSIKSFEARQIAKLLAGKIDAISIGLFGDRVHVVTGNTTSTRAEIQKVIKEAGLPATDVRTIDASLEDVFVSVIGQTGATGNA